VKVGDVRAFQAVEDRADVPKAVNLLPPLRPANYPAEEWRPDLGAIGAKQDKVLAKREVEVGGDEGGLPRVATSGENHVVGDGLCLPCPLGEVLYGDASCAGDVYAPVVKLRYGHVGVSMFHRWWRSMVAVDQRDVGLA
jgi:hypothetical protein